MTQSEYIAIAKVFASYRKDHANTLTKLQRLTLDQIAARIADDVLFPLAFSSAMDRSIFLDVCAGSRVQGPAPI